MGIHGLLLDTLRFGSFSRGDTMMKVCVYEVVTVSDCITKDRWKAQGKDFVLHWCPGHQAIRRELAGEESWGQGHWNCFENHGTLAKRLPVTT